MAVRRRDKARLARLAAPLVFAESVQVRRRQGWRQTVQIGEVAREVLLHEGVDPALAYGMRGAERAAAALAAIPDTPELQQADEDYCAREDSGQLAELWSAGRRRSRSPPIPEKTFESEVRRLMQRYRERPEIDFATAPLVQLSAWCLSRPCVSTETAADGSLFFCIGQPQESGRGDADSGELPVEDQ